MPILATAHQMSPAASSQMVSARKTRRRQVPIAMAALLGRRCSARIPSTSQGMQVLQTTDLWHKALPDRVPWCLMLTYYRCAIALFFRILEVLEQSWRRIKAAWAQTERLPTLLIT